MGYGLCSGPWSLLIALGLQILGVVVDGSEALLVRKLVIWHARCFHFRVLGNPWTILGHQGAKQRMLYGPGLDFHRFSMDLVTDFGGLFCTLDEKRVSFSCLFPGCFF